MIIMVLYFIKMFWIVLCHFATNKFEKAYHVAVVLCRRRGGHEIIFQLCGQCEPETFPWMVHIK